MEVLLEFYSEMHYLHFTIKYKFLNKGEYDFFKKEN